MNVLSELRGRFAAALAGLTDDPTDLLALVLPSQGPKFGDYQANCAMPLAKRIGRPPREVAEEIISKVDVGDLCEAPEVAGPGFVNLRLRDDWVAAQTQRLLADERLGVVPTEAPRTLVIDFSSPNVAKPMHVGHIRSTVIGDALVRVLRELGHTAISDNHIGDWGTQFGMILYGVKHLADADRLAARPVDELGRLYKLVSRLAGYQEAKRALPDAQRAAERAKQRVDALSSRTMPLNKDEQKKEAKAARDAEQQYAAQRETLEGLQKRIEGVEAEPELQKLADAHPKIGKRALEETAKLHSGDAENVALWKQYLPACLEELNATYGRLNVTFDHTLGESFYHDALAGVVDDLKAKGIATQSDGAVCVFIDGQDAPMIVQKQDGAFLYATTDLATIQHRLKTWQPDAIVYVVDHRQSLHFEQLFAAARKWGVDDVELTHVAFGTVLDEDGKPYKTRSGSAVGLMGLLDEAVERARAIADQSPALETDDQRAAAAERIGIGAIKYADLAHNRTSDYVFSYDKMLAMQGNTAAYLQYSYARVRGIFDRGGVDPAALRKQSPAILLGHPAERALAMALLRFPEALERVAADYRPNHLTSYLFELASRYSEFFEHCPVLKADDPASRDSRLALCDLTARVLQRGLGLLGIQAVERM
ncbi:Arginine--tRNA ligase [Pirellulimonas nuda]|uniref:Arginine--tRNA ligase n=1 Tax=Pirellulimonas nuda TaxID=2528009 RepID=A0A518DHB5_9BACT|nr:arginine--tRNA ligase [Pirellulimonas nuda]QDU90867.1 Arginine--tRNA ligase [Pirellulimonas nuda]